MAKVEKNYIICGNTGAPSRARIIEACILTHSKIHQIHAPYGLKRGCRIEYLIRMDETLFEEFKKISKCGHTEIQGELKVN